MNFVERNRYGKTELHRHPVIFAHAKQELKSPKHIVSFGCSTGEECITLAELFPEASILGIEINDARRMLALPHERVTYAKELVAGSYDAIFCMSVLCRHPETDILNDCSQFYKFSDFESETSFLASLLVEGGLLVLFNTTFFFEDTETYKLFVGIDIPAATGEYVRKFGTDNRLTNRSSKKYLFRKRG